MHMDHHHAAQSITLHPHHTVHPSHDTYEYMLIICMHTDVRVHLDGIST